VQARTTYDRHLRAMFVVTYTISAGATLSVKIFLSTVSVSRSTVLGVLSVTL
jgi:hypothetical protein